MPFRVLQETKTLFSKITSMFFSSIKSALLIAYIIFLSLALINASISGFLVSLMNLASNTSIIMSDSLSICSAMEGNFFLCFLIFSICPVLLEEKLYLGLIFQLNFLAL